MTLTPADRAAGSLLGLALGDALGFVVEAAAPAEAAEYVRAELRQGLAGARARAPFSPGQYSDDTQLARELLLSIRESRGFDPAAFAMRLARLFAEGRAVGAGPGCRGAAERLAAGTPWDRAGAPPPYAGNGAAWRPGRAQPIRGRSSRSFGRGSSRSTRRSRTRSPASGTGSRRGRSGQGLAWSGSPV